jgi:predicted Zn-dependent protease
LVAKDIAGSFRALTDSEKKELQPLRIKIIKVGPTDTLASLAAMVEGTTRKTELFRMLNALSPGQQVVAGSLVKIIAE